jgi:uncharacterized protein
MQLRVVCALGLAVAAVACSERWPDPPAVDAAKYQQEYEAWREEEVGTAAYALPLVGIWPLQEGDTAFGADPGLPIVVPASDAPARAGVVRLGKGTLTLLPASDARITSKDGAAITAATVVMAPFDVGSTRFEAWAYDGGAWVEARNQKHPAAMAPPAVPTYAITPAWRVAARFDAFDKPKTVSIADVRGGRSDYESPGQLVFRVNGQEMRLTALQGGAKDQFFVMFKDATNDSTTYSGYRIVRPAAVARGEWTVIDFNLASNPPCAYSSYTVCPLPPPENKLPVAVEAGAQRHPLAKGYGG